MIGKNKINKQDKLALFLLGVILVVAFGAFYWFFTKPAGAIYIDSPKDCREVLAPNPEQFEANIAKIGTVNATYKWFEDPEGTWTLKIDIDPQGGENHRNWQSTYPQNWGLLFKKPVALPQTIVEKSCVPTPTPTPSPEPGTPPTFAEKEGTPVCTTGETLLLPGNLHVVRHGASADVNFFITQGDSANIYWKEVSNSSWQHAIANVQGNSDHYVSFTVNDLDPMLGYSFGIQQKYGCGTGQLATYTVVDGPESVTFRPSYWSW